MIGRDDLQRLQKSLISKIIKFQQSRKLLVINHCKKMKRELQIKESICDTCTLSDFYWEKIKKNQSWKIKRQEV